MEDTARPLEKMAERIAYLERRVEQLEALCDKLKGALSFLRVRVTKTERDLYWG